MSQLMGDDLILKINRPQYVPFPELFLSELAWRLADLPIGQALCLWAMLEKFLV